MNLAFAESREGSESDGVYVEDVVPAPDCGRLLVYVAVPEHRPVVEVLAELRADLPRLRAELAMAIARKRAPELSFAPFFDLGGKDE